LFCRAKAAPTLPAVQVAWKLESAATAYSDTKDAECRGWEMPYQYVREPLSADESDRLSNAGETTTERLVVSTLLDTGLCVGELCALTSKSVLWQQRQLRFKGKGGHSGKKTKVRVVPMSIRVRAILEHHFAREKAFPVKTRRAQDIVKAVANRARITKGVSPHVLRHAFATTALQKGISLPTVQKILGHICLQTTAIYLNFTHVHIQDRFRGHHT
jgi:integrase/recombinase XerD